MYPLNDNEVWKDIPNYEGLYQVSNLGRIKSLGRHLVRSNGWEMKLKEKLLKQNATYKGYLSVKLYTKDKNKYSLPVHRIVMNTFVGKCDELQVNHINGDKKDNRLMNLEYVDQFENMNHRATVINRKPRGITRHLGKWQARIVFNNKCISIGHFESKSEAYKAYFDKFLELRGVEPWDLNKYPTHKKRRKQHD